LTYQNDEDDTITSITADPHNDNKTISDVTMFHSDKNIFKKFPKNIANIFGNIEMVDVYEAGIKEIKSEDLQQFGRKLKSLWLMRNEIRRVNSEAFVYNPNLEWINLSENNILHVELGTFNFAFLKNLNKLYFKLNPCYSGSASDSEKLKELIAKIDIECKSDLYIQNQNQAIAAKNVNLLDENQEIKANATELLSLIESKNQKIDQLLLKISEFQTKKEEKISKLNVKVARLTEKCATNDAVTSSVHNIVKNMQREVKKLCKN
jgi:hypothetical protein